MRDRRWLVALILGVALAARLGFVAATPHVQPTGDAHALDFLGLAIAHGSGYHQALDPFGRGTAVNAQLQASRPPGYPAFLAGIYALAGDGDQRWLAARIGQALLGCASVALLGLVALRLWGRAVALVAMGVAAVYVPLVAIGEAMVSEALFVPLVLGALAAVPAFRHDGRWRWLAVAGVLVGLSTLTRANGLVLAVPLALLAVQSGRPRLAPGALLATAAPTVAPWTLRNALVMHAFIPSATRAA